MPNSKVWRRALVTSILIGCLYGAAAVLIGIYAYPVSASSIGELAYRFIQNAGSPLTQRTTINFHGSGVTASDLGGLTDVNIPGGSSGYNTVENQGVPLTQRTTINFHGSGVTASDLGGITDVNIPGGSSSFGAPNTTCPFTASTSVTCTHNLGTTAVVVQCFDNGSPPAQIEWNSLALTSTNVVTVTFSLSQTGKCIINGTQGSGQNVTPETMTFTVDNTMNVILCDATGGTVSANLPPIATAGLGRMYAMKKTDAGGNSCTFTPNGSETIDGSATRTNTTQFQSYTIITDGTTGWYII